MPARKIFALLGFLLFVLFLPNRYPAFAQTGSTLVVPDQYQTIQQAIDAANPGDTVSVTDGTYSGAGNTNLDPGGKAIRIQSMNGPNACIIDCQGNSRAFILQSAETASTVISGFTIENGSDGGQNGAAIYMGQSVSALIQNCLFSNNTATGSGGAIYFDTSAGGQVTDCRFVSNKASLEGGAIDCNGASPLISGTTMDQNGALLGGGAISSNNGASPIIVNCLITNNSSGEGAAIYFINSGSSVITNCTFSGNQASQTNGALYFGDTTPVTPVVVTNSILWGDLPAEIASAAGATGGNTGFTVTYSDISGTYPGTNNIAQDPQFFNPTITPGSWPDYHLQPSSPCVDTGNNYAPSIQQYDMNHCTRQFGAAVDMGAYELQNVTMNATVSIEDGTGTPVSSIYLGQDASFVISFNNLNNLEVAANNLMGRTIKFTFNSASGALGANQKLTSFSEPIGDLQRGLIAEGLPYVVPITTPPGAFTLTGKVVISGLRCLSNTNSFNSSVLDNPPVTFTYPAALPAASTTNPAVNAYRMIGCPVVPAPDNDSFDTFSSFFGGVYDPTQWRLYHAGASGLKEITASGQDQIGYGRGWWIISASAKTLSVTGLPMMWDDGTFMTAGYHMVANPFYDTTLPWSAVVQNNPALGTNSVLYEWGTNGNFVSASSMVPGKSYWVWCPVDMMLYAKRSFATAAVKHSSSSPKFQTLYLPPPAPSGSFMRLAVSRTAKSASSKVSTMSATTKALRQPPPPLPPEAYLQVLSPKGGETLRAGARVAVRWKSYALSPQKADSSVQIALSTDGGKTYSTVASHVRNTGTYTWTVPRRASGDCLIKVTSTLYTSVSGASAKVFSIR